MYEHCTAAAVSTLPETAGTPAAAAALQRTRPSDRPPKPAATPAAAPAPGKPVNTPVADTFAPTAPVGAPPETASTPVAPATKPATSRSSWMLAYMVLVVLLIGGAVPLYNRWRKRKLLEQTQGQNLSFTHKASSDPGNSDTTGGHKAA
jgi:hypothetical protein